MLPILNTLEFSEIIPLSESITTRYALESGINAMYAENGRGKTTLCDIIERSLCSDAHSQRYSAFSKKRKTKNAYIKGTWAAEKEFNTHQALTDSGIRTKLREKGKSEKSFSKQDYSNYLRREFNLSLEEFQYLFQSLYYKREDDHALLGRTIETDITLNSFFDLINKYTAGSPEDIRLRQKIKEKQRERKIVNVELKKEEEKENRIRMVMDQLGISEVSEAILEAKHSDIKKKMKQKEETIKNIEKEKEHLEKEEEEESKKLYNLRDDNYEIRASLDKVRTKKNELTKQKRKVEKEIELAAKVGNEKYDYLKSKVKRDPRCDFCNTNLLSEWDRRINIGCPICGTEWARLPRELREGIFEEPEIPETEGLELEIQKIDLEIEEIEKEIKKKEEEFQKAKEEERTIQQRVAETKSQIKVKEKEIRDKMKELNELSKNETMIQSEREMIKKKIDLQSILDRKRKLQQKLDRIENEIEDLKNQESYTNEQTQILDNFHNTTIEVFGYGVAINPRDKSITLMADHSTRAFDSLSGGEKYFIDIALRIAVWRYLMEKNFTHQGMLVIDSPESSLDIKRLDLLAEILNEFRGQFLFVVTTRNKEFYEKLDANELEIKRQIQTSLFDFVEQETQT